MGLPQKNAARTPKVRRPLGPHSRALHRGAIGGLIDGRSKEGRFLRSYESMLLGHIGGPAVASPVQAALVSRAARLALQIELMDDRNLANGGAMSDADSKRYLAWHGALTRTLRLLGLEAKPAPAPTLDEIMAEVAAEDTAA